MIIPIGDPNLPVSWARAYQLAGMAVLPLARLGNIPHPDILGRGWSFETLEVDVEDCWSQDPCANIGVITGWRSGYLVLDLDVKVVDGRESLRAWLTETGRDLPSGPYCTTPSGGVHVWYRLPPGRDVRRKICWLAGVDACGSGGFVAVPPSVRRVGIRSPKPWEPGVTELREYEWLRHGMEVPVAPDWLLEDIAERVPTLATGGVVTREFGNGDRLPETSCFLDRGFGWFSGSRNRDCFRLAWRLWSLAKSEEQVATVLLGCLDKTPVGTHPFTWAECWKTALSARRRHEEFSARERDEALENLRRWVHKDV